MNAPMSSIVKGDKVRYDHQVWYADPVSRSRVCLYIRPKDIGNDEFCIYCVPISFVTLYQPPPPRELTRQPSSRHPLSVSDEETELAIQLIQALRGNPQGFNEKPKQDG
jgi:hypothetical protein